MSDSEVNRAATQNGRSGKGERLTWPSSSTKKKKSTSRRACQARSDLLSRVAINRRPSDAMRHLLSAGATSSLPQTKTQEQEYCSTRRKGAKHFRLGAKKTRLYDRGGGALSPEEEADDENEEDDEDEEDEEEEDEEEEDDDEEYDPMTPKGPLDNNNYGEVWLPIQARPRRNRKTRAVRKLIQENIVKPSSLIYPLFVHDQETSVPIASMPGQKRLSIRDLVKEVEEAHNYGINAFMLFPSVEPSLKTNMGEESYNPDGLIPRAIAAVKEKLPNVLLLADVALDPYQSHGQDGVVDEATGKVLNDISVHQSCKQAITLARAGADMICPSEMMDGRVSALREALDLEGWTDVSILAYSCKYASSLYSPFRDALASHPSAKGDKKTYQMDVSNGREAEREAELDAVEGADMLLIKPGMSCLDILQRVKRKTHLPLAVYQVSGEYAMIKAAALNKWISEKEVALELIKCMRRAGADVIATYYAKDIARWLHEDSSLAAEPCY